MAARVLPAHFNHAEPMLKAAALLLFFALMTACQSLRAHEKPTGDYFSVITYNINREPTHPQATIDTIAAADADVVILQESTPQWEAAITESLRDSYPHMQFRHYARGGGLAVLSRFEIEELAYIQSPAKKYPGWVIDVSTPAGKVQLLAAHLHAPVNARGEFTLYDLLRRSKDRLREIETYTAALTPDRPTLVLGDFNENDTGQALRLMREQGYTNALSEFDRSSHTWSLLPGLPLITNRTDHILYSEQLYCFTSRVLNFGGSDHRPVYAVFSLRDTFAQNEADAPQLTSTIAP